MKFYQVIVYCNLYFTSQTDVYNMAIGEGEENATKSGESILKRKYLIRKLHSGLRKVWDKDKCYRISISL